MKNLLILFMVLFSALFANAQSKTDYEHAMKRVQKYLNASQTDHLCALFQPDSDGNCVWTDNEIASILNCFGKIESATLRNPYNIIAQDGKVYFKVKCSKRTVTLSCKLNELLKFSHFEFNDKSTDVKRLQGQGSK